ncbi:MAG: adenylyl-sulfate kinase [Candidatus Omnitrophica bacterium]|nr:adenylyl-sulfate kinase [Candidatus Omnitrophota bacterium]
MFRETKRRSALKTISWRVVATLTTTLLVFIFTGKLSIAITVGSIEVIAKLIFYFFHERMWDKINFGRRELNPFVIWLTGLPASGKTTIGDALAGELKKMNIKTERLDAHQVRDIFPEEGFSREERNRHIKRVGHLASVLEKNNVCVIASFISPYTESRDFVRGLCRNFVEVYISVSLETCQKRDSRGLYEKARRGEIQNFTGISDTYEEPVNPEIIIDTDHETIEESVRKISSFVKKKYL